MLREVGGQINTKAWILGHKFVNFLHFFGLKNINLPKIASFGDRFWA